MKRFEYHTYTSKMSHIEDVIKAMETLGEELIGTNLENLRAFNSTYLIITKNVTQKLHTHYFNDDNLMVKLDIHFAKYYFDALKSYVDHGICAPAWKLCFDECQKSQSWQFIYMALGVNAHVNNDLAFVLHEVINRPSEYKSDFDNVNTLIYGALHEVIRTLHEESQLLNHMKDHLENIYAYFLKALIKLWRDNAWKHSLALSTGEIGSTNIENKAFDIGYELTISDHFRSALHFVPNAIHAVEHKLR